MSNQTQDIFEPDDIFKQIVIFLDNDLRLSMSIYERSTQTRNRFSDMLIEINITKQNGDFGKLLAREFYAFLSVK